MAYLAMARKWRPRNFEEMVGQDHIAQTIRNAIEGKRISHAYLFTGTRGVGKTTSARILAKALNCGNGPTPIPCDVCDNCKAVNAGNSMDVLEIDGASNNSVDNIRDLREQVKYAPMHGTYKIYVIDEVHMLSKSAFNALLKTLEEPPAHVIFIFATTEANKLPHTILSRVQRFDFKRISESNIRERLEFICSQEAITPEREALEAIARKADGSMRDALSLFDQVYAFSGADLTMEAARKVLGLPRESLFDGLLAALIRHDQKSCFSAIQEAHREGIETTELLVAFGEYFRNLLFSRQGVSAAALGLGEARYAELCVLAPELRDGDIIRFAKMISDLLAQLKTSANQRLAVELGFARMASLDRVVTLSQVLGQDFSASAPPPAADSSAESKKKNPIEKLSPAPEVALRAIAATPLSAPVASYATAPLAAPAASLATAPSATTPPAAPSAAATAFIAAPAVSSGFTATSPARATASAATAASAARTDSATDLLESVETPYPGPDRNPAGEPDQDSPSETAGAQIESELDREMEDAYDRDADDPESPPFPARTSADAAQETIEVPSQDSPESLPALWPQLLGEFISARPLLGAHLTQTRLEWETGEAPGLRVTFLERAAYFLIGDDADFRKAIHGFLAAKVRGRMEFPVRFSLDEAAAASESRETVQLPFGSDDPLRMPIVAFIRDVFEGRQLN